MPLRPVVLLVTWQRATESLSCTPDAEGATLLDITQRYNIIVETSLIVAGSNIGVVVSQQCQMSLAMSHMQMWTRLTRDGDYLGTGDGDGDGVGMFQNIKNKKFNL